MSINISTNGTEFELINKLNTKSSLLVQAVAEKMNFLIKELAEKVRRGTTSSRVAESVKSEVIVQGNVVVGTVQAGPVEVTSSRGKFDLAQIQESGAAATIIYPVNRLALKWQEAGKPVFAKHADRKALLAKHFFSFATEGMESRLTSELGATVTTELK